MPKFLPRCRRWTCLWAAIFAASLGVPAWGDGTDGVVVLRNGNVLQGAVRRSGDYYFIEQGGASLQVPAEQVEMACGSLAEAYELRREDRVGTSADSHLELARWCLRNNLLDQAAREVLDARTRDPGHPALASLDIQIRQVLEIDAARRERAMQAGTAGAQHAGAIDVSETPTTPLLSPPAEAQTQFVRSIQPMLIHGCATGGCHQADSPQQMRLDRWALDGNGNPALIRRNLDAILAQITPEDPASSPLIVRARQAHGARNALSRPLATYQAALLLDWLNAAAGVEPAPAAEIVVPAAAEAVEGAPTLIDDLQSTPKPATASPALAHFTPRDEFDPEIFHRQVAALKAAQETINEQAEVSVPAPSQQVNAAAATEYLQAPEQGMSTPTAPGALAGPSSPAPR